MTSRITSVRFAAKWTEPHPDRRFDLMPQACERVAQAEFFLGRGPCGKTVTKLSAVYSRGQENFQVEQDHDDGTSKVFIYRREDILGRIEIETGPSE
jgi:hypothetical protein